MWAIRISESSPSSSEGSKVVREKAELATREAWMTSLRGNMEPNRHGFARHLDFDFSIRCHHLVLHYLISIYFNREFLNVF